MRLMILGTGLFVVLLGCKQGPNEVFIHTIPRTGEVTAGDSIQLTAVTDPQDIKGAKYEWHIKATCPIKIEGKGKSVVMKPDLYCFAQKATVTVTVSVGDSHISKSKEISILENPQLPPRLPLNPNMKGWLIINNYSRPDSNKKNNLGAAVTTWSYAGGVCKTSVTKGALRLTYDLPSSESLCGTVEYFKGELNKAQPYDISRYKKVSIKLKSGDDRMHQVKLVIIEYDPMHTANQGIVAESSTLKAFVGRWWRYEVSIRPTVGELFDLKRTKSIGLKVIGPEGDHGTILVDDLALIPGH